MRTLIAQSESTMNDSLCAEGFCSKVEMVVEDVLRGATYFQQDSPPSAPTWQARHN